MAEVETESAVAMVRGHELYFDTDVGWWRYFDTGDLLGDPDWSGEPWMDGRCEVGGVLVRFPDPYPPVRACIECNMVPTPEGYDACLGYLPGIVSACCGHGDPNLAYQKTAEDVEKRRQELLKSGVDIDA